MPRKAGGFKVRTGKGGFREEEHPRGRGGKFRHKAGSDQGAPPGERRVAIVGQKTKREFRGKAKKPRKEKIPTPAQQAELAKQPAGRVNKAVQRYSEERNEPVLARGMRRGGADAFHLRDNQPVDVVRTRAGRITDGVELKTKVFGVHNQIKMSDTAQARKAAWMAAHPRAQFHTIVFDDRKVYNAQGEGKHGPVTERVILYRRGFGSFRTGGMQRVRDMEELDRLMNMPTKDLPRRAQPPDGYDR